jgi:hypothetical protein
MGKGRRFPRVGVATQLLAMTVVIATCVSACAANTTEPDASPGQRPGIGAPLGRSVCPGAMSAVRAIVGAQVDVVEQIQAEYESAPGFLGVVSDGTRPIIIVDSLRLHEWQAQVSPLGLAVAPSCTSAGLLDAIKAVLPRLQRATGVTVIAGYDVLDDAIFVQGVDAPELVNALAISLPDAETLTNEAIAAGTLRLHPWNGEVTDAFPPVVPIPEQSR